MILFEGAAESMIFCAAMLVPSPTCGRGWRGAPGEGLPVKCADLFGQALSPLTIARDSLPQAGERNGAVHEVSK